MPIPSSCSLAFTLNGRAVALEVPAHALLLDVVRDRLGLKGAKRSCDVQVCGACTVLVDGAPVSACTYLAAEVDGREVLTVEGLADGDALHPLQEAFIEHGAVQCGFCTAGMLLSAKALLDEDPAPTRERIEEFLRGNLCRCTGYRKIVDAIEACAARPGGSPAPPVAAGPVDHRRQAIPSSPTHSAAVGPVQAAATGPEPPRGRAEHPASRRGALGAPAGCAGEGHRPRALRERSRARRHAPRAASALALPARAHHSRRGDPRPRGRRRAPRGDQRRPRLVRALLRPRVSRSPHPGHRRRPLRGRAHRRRGRRERGDRGRGPRPDRGGVRGASPRSPPWTRRSRPARRWCTRASRWPATSPISPRSGRSPAPTCATSSTWSAASPPPPSPRPTSSWRTSIVSRACSTTPWSRTRPWPPGTRRAASPCGRPPRIPTRSASSWPRLFRMPLGRIRIIVPPLGGGFGSKTYAKLEPIVGRAGPHGRAPGAPGPVGGGGLPHRPALRRARAGPRRVPARRHPVGGRMPRRLRRGRLRRHRPAHHPEGHLHGHRPLPRAARRPPRPRRLHQHHPRRRLPRLRRPPARLGPGIADRRRGPPARPRSRRSPPPEPPRPRRGVLRRRHAHRREVRGKSQPRGRGDSLDRVGPGRPRPGRGHDAEGQHRAHGLGGHRAPARRRQRHRAGQHGGDGTGRAHGAGADCRRGARRPRRARHRGHARHRHHALRPDHQLQPLHDADGPRRPGGGGGRARSAPARGQPAPRRRAERDCASRRRASAPASSASPTRTCSSGGSA